MTLSTGRPESLRPPSGRPGRNGLPEPPKGGFRPGGHSPAPEGIENTYPAAPPRGAAEAGPAIKKAAAAKAAAARRNPDGVGRAARSRTCPRCSRPVFEGLDADRAALVVRVDAAPLSAVGEAQALLGGRTTYSLLWVAGRSRYEIDVRNHWQIEAHPPGADVNRDVVTEHECGAPELPRIPTAIRRARKALPADADPPF